MNYKSITSGDFLAISKQMAKKSTTLKLNTETHSVLQQKDVTLKMNKTESISQTVPKADQVEII